MTIRLSFIAAAALIAAAAGDLCVEITADTGVFGGGYADTNHMGVAPAIVAAAMFTSGLLILRAVDSWRQRGRGNSTTRLLSAWLDNGGSPRSQIALIVPLQLLVVYGMESAEALMVRRDFPDGVSWLGTHPSLASSSFHGRMGGTDTFPKAIRWAGASKFGCATACNDRRSKKPLGRGVIVASRPPARIDVVFTQEEGEDGD